MDPDAKPNLVITGKLYDTLKLIALVILPALGSLYFGLSQIWDFPAGEEVVGTVSLLDAFLGAILGVSSKKYYASGMAYDGDMVVQTDGGGVRGYSMELNGDPEALAQKDTVSFRVQKNPVR